MTKRLSTFTYIAMAAWLVAGSALAGEGAPSRTVSTTGYGEVTTRPDRAEVQMQATATHKAAAEAKRAVDDRVNQLLEALDEQGIAESDIVASSLNVAPNYEFVDRERVFSGYRASREVRVTLKDLDKLDTLLQSAVDRNIHHIDQIALKTSRQEHFEQQAFEQAIADSRRKAEALARAYDAELGPVHSIDYRRDRPMPVPKQEMALARAGDSEGGQYLHDELTFSDRVEVVFELIIPR